MLRTAVAYVGGVLQGDLSVVTSDTTVSLSGTAAIAIAPLRVGLVVVSYGAVTTSARGMLGIKTVEPMDTIPANDWHPNRQRIDGTSDNRLQS